MTFSGSGGQIAEWLGCSTETVVRIKKISEDHLEVRSREDRIVTDGEVSGLLAGNRTIFAHGYASSVDIV
jgi:hypothetical protein